MLALFSAVMVANGQTFDLPELDAQLYRPPIDSEGTMWADTSGHIVDSQGRARGVVQYLSRPFVYVSDSSGDATILVSDAFQLDAIGSYHIGRFRVGLDVPVYLFTAGQLTNDGAGLGDVALDLRLTALDDADAPVGLAFTARGIFPTTTVDAPLGMSGVGAEVGAVLDGRAGKTLLVSNIVTRVQPSVPMANVEVNDQLVWRLGGGYDIISDAGLSADVVGQLNYSAQLSNPAGAPIEGMLGGWGRLSDAFVLRAGVGRGITPGIGSPAVRLVTSFGLEPAAKIDTDGDGFADDVDSCPLRPEDVDEFQDDDGCPDLSQQVKVLVVDKDRAPIGAAQSTLSGANETSVSGADALTAELHEGGYVVAASAPGYLDGTLSFGVPLPLGNEVVLVLEKEVAPSILVLRVEDEGGQPIEGASWSLGDEDGTPLEAGVARMTTAPGKRRIIAQADGYATVQKVVTLLEGATLEQTVVLAVTRVVVTAEKIELKESVYFETGKAAILDTSFAMLSEVAGVLVDHPEITLLRVEGHTDSRGSASSNKRLSQARADSVREYLEGKGVDGARLKSVGYGEEKPIDDRNNAEGWTRNRRVDLFIEERSDD